MNKTKAKDYLDMNTGYANYQLTDGIHLGIVSGAEASREIALWIYELRKRKTK